MPTTTNNPMMTVTIAQTTAVAVPMACAVTRVDARAINAAISVEAVDRTARTSADSSRGVDAFAGEELRRRERCGFDTVRSGIAFLHGRADRCGLRSHGETVGAVLSDESGAAEAVPLSICVSARYRRRTVKCLLIFLQVSSLGRLVHALAPSSH